MFMEISMKKHSQESGFALLMTLVVVGVVLSVGMSILDLSIKQVKLSTNAKESEIAFHAANAGMECARYWRRAEANKMEIGDPISPQCFSVTPVITISPVNPLPGSAAVTGDGEAFLYSYNFTWGPTSAVRCTQVDTLVASSSSLGAGVTITHMKDIFSGYPKTAVDPDPSSYCEPGSRCTVISVRGYNRTCPVNPSDPMPIGTVERDVLLQF